MQKKYDEAKQLKLLKILEQARERHYAAVDAADRCREAKKRLDRHKDHVREQERSRGGASRYVLERLEMLQRDYDRLEQLRVEAGDRLTQTQAVARRLKDYAVTHLDLRVPSEFNERPVGGAIDG